MSKIYKTLRGGSNPKDFLKKHKLAEHLEFCDRCDKHTAHKSTLMGYKCKHCSKLTL